MSAESLIVKTALADVKATGRFAGKAATVDNVKDGTRMAFHVYGTEGALDFLKGTGVKTRSILTDAKYGFDEVDYPKGASPIPPGGLVSTPPFKVKPMGTSRSAPKERVKILALRAEKNAKAAARKRR